MSATKIGDSRGEWPTWELKARRLAVSWNGKIQAIKLVRNETGMNLRESLAMVNEWIAEAGK